MLGEMGGFDAVAIQAHPEIEAVNHVHHAGNSSGIVDGAAAVLVGSQGGRREGRPQAARPHQAPMRNIGSEPALMLTGPVDVTEKLLKRAGMTARRHRPVRAQRGLRRRRAALHARPSSIRHDKINVNGGAIAMGHPLGATGAMILGTVLDELERRDLQHGAGHALHRRRHGHRHHHRAGLRTPSGAAVIEPPPCSRQKVVRHGSNGPVLLAPREERSPSEAVAAELGLIGSFKERNPQ